VQRYRRPLRATASASRLRPGEYGLGKYGLGKYGLGKYGLGKYGLGKYGLGKYHPFDSRLARLSSDEERQILEV